MANVHEYGRVLAPNNAVCERWFSQLRCYRGLQKLSSHVDLCEFMVSMRNSITRAQAVQRDLYRTAAVLHYNGVSEAHLKMWESRRAKVMGFLSPMPCRHRRCRVIVVDWSSIV